MAYKGGVVRQRRSSVLPISRLDVRGGAAAVAVARFGGYYGAARFFLSFPARYSHFYLPSFLSSFVVLCRHPRFQPSYQAGASGIASGIVFTGVIEN